MDDLIQQGVDAFKAGNRESARKLLSQAIKQNPDSERAWGWIYNVCNTDQERIQCLKQIIRINPNNEKAKQRLNEMTVSDFPLDSPIPQPTPDNKPHSAPVATSLPEKKKSTNFLAMAIFGVIAFCAVCGFLYLAANLSDATSGRKVKYVVTGNTGSSSITYTNETGGNNSNDVSLPFQKEITLKESGLVTITAWPGINLNLTGTITCEIWVNGEMKETNTARNTLASCVALVP